MVWKDVGHDVGCATMTVVAFVVVGVGPLDCVNVEGWMEVCEWWIGSCVDDGSWNRKVSK